MSRLSGVHPGSCGYGLWRTRGHVCALASLPRILCSPRIPLGAQDRDQAETTHTQLCLCTVTRGKETSVLSSPGVCWADASQLQPCPRFSSCRKRPLQVLACSPFPGAQTRLKRLSALQPCRPLLLFLILLEGPATCRHRWRLEQASKSIQVPRPPHTYSRKPLTCPLTPGLLSQPCRTERWPLWAEGRQAGETAAGGPFPGEHRDPLCRCPPRPSLLMLVSLPMTGAGLDGVEEIKRHPFFATIDWNVSCMPWSQLRRNHGGRGWGCAGGGNQAATGYKPEGSVGPSPEEGGPRGSRPPSPPCSPRLFHTLSTRGWLVPGPHSRPTSLRTEQRPSKRWELLVWGLRASQVYIVSCLYSGSGSHP